MVAIGTVFGARWVVERPLSAGGMGVVYVAKHIETGRLVALKVIKSDAAQDPELVSRFKKETGALASVAHPNVVTFLDSGVEDGTFYLVMELLSGRPLRAVMREPQPWSRAYKIAADICRALLAVHAQGIVHRDLKPENVFLVDAAGHDEIAKLIDFGIARLENTSSTRNATKTGAIIGTPGYIAPEQLQGMQATEASDVYAVGVILYELITGRFPFEAPTPHAMLVKQLIDPLPAPRAVLPSIPADVEALILSFMQRDPQLRVPSARAALTALTVLPSAALTPVPATTPATATPSPPLSLPPDAATELGTRATPLAVAPIVARPAPPSRAPVFIVLGAAALLIFFVVGIVAVAVIAKRRDERAARVERELVEQQPSRVEQPVAHGEKVHGGDNNTSGTKFAGSWRASYAGSFVLPGVPAQTNTADADISVRALADQMIEMTMVSSTGSVCAVTLQRVDEDTAVLAPVQQSCAFVNPDGSQQTNTFAGTAQLHGGTISFPVEGTFGLAVNGVPYQGGFRGTWTLRRNKSGGAAR